MFFPGFLFFYPCSVSFAVSFPSHTPALFFFFFTLLFCPFVLHFGSNFSLSCYVRLFLVPLFPSEPFPASPVPQTMRQRFTRKRCQPQCTALTYTNSQMPTWWLVDFPSFIFLFHSLLALYSSLSVLSLFLSLSAADLWDQPSKTDSHFFTDHECVSGYATEREGERERVGERERERTCEYVTDIFVHLYLGCCLSPKRISLLGKPLPQRQCLICLPEIFEQSLSALLLGKQKNVLRSQTPANGESVHKRAS